MNIQKSIIGLHTRNEQLEFLIKKKFPFPETSLVVQWLRLHTPNAGGLGLIPGWGTRSHMPQLRVCMLQQGLKILDATTKTQYSKKKKIPFPVAPNKNVVLRYKSNKICTESVDEKPENTKERDQIRSK